jgi:hypothetical protein
LKSQQPTITAKKKIPAFHETRRLTTASHWIFFLSHECSPHTHTLFLLGFLRSILILSSHLRLGLPSGLFPSGFQTKILFAFLISPMRTTCHSHLDFLALIIVLYKYQEVKSINIRPETSQRSNVQKRSWLFTAARPKGNVRFVITVASSYSYVSRFLILEFQLFIMLQIAYRQAGWRSKGFQYKI